MHQAAFTGQGYLIKVLLDRGIAQVEDLEVQDPEDDTPMHYASLGNQAHVLQILATAGASTSPCNSSQETPLHWAAREGHLRSTKMLSGDLMADVEAPDNRHRRPLHYAARHGKADIASALLNAGAYADPADVDGKRPLALACKYGSLETIKVLLYKANPNVHDNSKRSPLYWASRASPADGKAILDLLQAAGESTQLSLDYLQPTHDMESFALFLVEKASVDPSEVWSPTLQRKLSAVPLWDCSQETRLALINAAFEAHKSQIIWTLALNGMHEELVQRGGDASSWMDQDALDGMGRQALFYACASQCVETIKYFLSRPGQLRTLRDRKGRSPLDVVANRDSRREVEALLQNPGAARTPHYEQDERPRDNQSEDEPGPSKGLYNSRTKIVFIKSNVW